MLPKFAVLGLEPDDDMVLEEEAAELEPLLARTRPIPVSPPATNAVYPGDLESELEEEAEELEPLYLAKKRPRIRTAHSHAASGAERGGP
jgi:hypothetical protein